MNTKTAFQFPGQGSQYVGMGKKLYEQYNEAKEVFGEVSSILGYDISKICFDGSITQLMDILNMSATIITVSVAAYRSFKSEYNLKPQFMLGHSLGEFSALCCSGVLSLKDVIEIIKFRCELADEVNKSSSSGFTVINNISPQAVQEICRKVSNNNTHVSIACYNSSIQVIISGHDEKVQQAEDELIKLGAEITPILTSPPFHTPLMEKVSKRLQEKLNEYEFKMPHCPVIFNYTASPHIDPNTIKLNLSAQIFNPVLWQQSLDYLKIQGIETLVELGSSAILTNLSQELKCFESYAYGQQDDREALRKIIKTDNGSNEPKKTVVTRCLAVAVCTKNNNWNDDEYVRGVELPYEKIEKMQDELDQSNLEPTVEQMQEALTMLKSVFETKKTPHEERKKRFHQIFEETGTKEVFKDFNML